MYGMKKGGGKKKMNGMNGMKKKKKPAKKKPMKRMGYQNEEKTYCKEANGTARGYFEEAFGASQRKAHGYDA